MDPTPMAVTMMAIVVAVQSKPSRARDADTMRGIVAAALQRDQPICGWVRRTRFDEVLYAQFHIGSDGDGPRPRPAGSREGLRGVLRCSACPIVDPNAVRLGLKRSEIGDLNTEGKPRVHACGRWRRMFDFWRAQ